MKNGRRNAILFAISASVALASNAFAIEVNDDDECLEGYEYVSAVDACVAEPYTIDRTPGAFGCMNGGIRSAHGRSFCFKRIHGWVP